MKKNSKSEQQLIDELEVLRQHVLRLEKERIEKSELWTKQEELEMALRERIKELNCLYKISESIELHGDSLDKIFMDVASLLPVSWQYPEITCSRIIYGKKEYKTANFKQSKWKQESQIIVDGSPAGKVEVYYLKKMPVLDEGPFLEEERQLINAVSGRLGKVAERVNMSKQLEIERNTLKNTNIALHEVLEKIQNEKRMIGASIQANVDKIIFPIIYAFEKELNPQQKEYLTILKSNLENIITPFADKVQEDLSKLSPTEILICNMIKNGLSTKEIARMRKISPDTVNRHRESIRRKLGLVNKKINLVSYLNNTPSEMTS